MKTFATEDREASDMERLGQGYIAANVRLARVRAVTLGWIGLMGALGMAVILWVGGERTIAGRFDKAGMLAFFTYLVMLTWPMMTFGFVISMVQRGAAGVDRLAEVFCRMENVLEQHSGRRSRLEVV